MPLSDTPWELGKCAYKLIQYMACGLPVVASAVGANKVVVNKNTGILVNNNDDWYNALTYYIAHFEKRKEHGYNGRKEVENSYCTEKQNEKYLNLFKYI